MRHDFPIVHAVDSTHAIVSENVSGRRWLQIVEIATGRALTVEGCTLADVRDMVRRRPVAWFVRAFGSMPGAARQWHQSFKPGLAWSADA